MLLTTRQWLLQKLVLTQIASDLATVRKLAGQRVFTLAVICHTIPPEERDRAIALLCALFPNITILCLVAGVDSPPTPIAQRPGCIAVHASPQALLRTISACLRSADRSI